MLIHRTADDDIWPLPGGRRMVGETAAEAAIREMREEIAAEIVPGEVLWVIENFFRTNSLAHVGLGGEESRHHEIGIYIEAKMPPDLEALDAFMGTELAGTDTEFALEFRWFDSGQFRGIDLRPAVLADLLNGTGGAPLGGGPRSLQHRVVGMTIPEAGASGTKKLAGGNPRPAHDDGANGG